MSSSSPARRVGIALDEPRGELALERDHGQAVAEQVVQVARDPQPLLGDGEPRELLAGVAQLAVRPRDRAPNAAISAPIATDVSASATATELVAARLAEPDPDGGARTPVTSERRDARGRSSPRRRRSRRTAATNDGGAPARAAADREQREQRRAPATTAPAPRRASQAAGGSTAR